MNVTTLQNPSSFLESYFFLVHRQQTAYKQFQKLINNS